MKKTRMYYCFQGHSSTHHIFHFFGIFSCCPVFNYARAAGFCPKSRPLQQVAKLPPYAGERRFAMKFLFVVVLVLWILRGWVLASPLRTLQHKILYIIPPPAAHKISSPQMLTTGKCQEGGSGRVIAPRCSEKFGRSCFVHHQRACEVYVLPAVVRWREDRTFLIFLAGRRLVSAVSFFLVLFHHSVVSCQSTVPVAGSKISNF